VKLTQALVVSLLAICAFGCTVCVAACPSATHQTTVSDFALSPDASRIAAIADDGTFFWWDVASGRRTEVMQCVQNGGFIVFSPDSSKVAYRIYGAIHLYEFSSGQVTQRLTEPRMGEIENIVFSADGQRLAAAHGEGVTVWDIKTNKVALSIPQRTERYALALSGDGGLVAVDGPKGVDLWDLTKKEVVRTIALHGEEHAEGLVFAHGDRWIAGTMAAVLPRQPGDRWVRFRRYIGVWETATGRPVKNIAGPFEEQAYPLTLSDSGALYTTSYDAILRAWSLDQGRLEHEWKTRPGKVSGDGRFLLRGTGYTGRLELWPIGDAQSNARKFDYRSPLCEAIDFGASSSEKRLRLTATFMGDGITEDGHTIGMRGLVAQDCTQIGVDHYYFPSEERAKEELHRLMKGAAKIVQQGPPNCAWSQFFVGERAVVMFAGDESHPDGYFVLRTSGKEFLRVGSSSLEVLLEFERWFFSDPPK
jgi:hypothetical protein